MTSPSSPEPEPTDDEPRMSLNQEEQDELAELGLTLVPDDHWVYKQGTVFFVDNNQVDDEPKAPPSIREVLERLGLGRNPLPADDDLYQSGAHVFLPRGEQLEQDA